MFSRYVTYSKRHIRNATREGTMGYGGHGVYVVGEREIVRGREGGRKSEREIQLNTGLGWGNSIKKRGEGGVALGLGEHVLAVRHLLEPSHSKCPQIDTLIRAGHGLC